MTPHDPGSFRRPPDPDDLSGEIDEELRFHIERRMEDLRRKGMSEADARREAHRRFGDVDRLRGRLVRRGRIGLRLARARDWFWQDLRYAFRQLVASPVLAAVVVGTLALGVGATTSVFSVVDAVVFRPLPFPEPEELVGVGADLSRQGGPADEWMNFPNYYDLGQRTRTLEALGTWASGTATLTGRGNPAEIGIGAASYHTFSEVLRVSPALGRLYTAEEDQPGAPDVAVVTDGFWRRVLGADSAVVGSTLVLRGSPYSVVGVLGPDFDPPFAREAEIWVPMREDITSHGCQRGGACLRVVARLGQGVELADAREDADRIAAELEAEHPLANENTGISLIPLREDMLADRRAGMLALLSAVALVLLVACVNVASLLMARSTARRAEFAVRSALGAARSRLTAQLLTESALLALLGGMVGVAAAFIGKDILVSVAPSDTPRLDSAALDGRVLGFALAVTALSGLIFGVVPSLRGAGESPAGALRARSSVGHSRVRGVRLRQALVSGQIALALMLLVGAGLLVQSFDNLRTRDLGFEPAGVTTASLDIFGADYSDAEARRRFTTSVEERLGALPGVTSVGTTSWLPFTGAGFDTGFNIEGVPPPPSGELHNVWYRVVTPAYPRAMGMRLLAGRWLDETDGPRAPRAVLINDGLARRYLGEENPIGRRINLGSPDVPLWREIVGMVAEVRHFGLRDDSRNGVYIPYAQSIATPRTNHLVLRSSIDPASLDAEIRGTIAELDPSLAVGRVVPMESLVSAALGPDRFVTLLLLGFAGIGLLLASIGLYGAMSYAVGLRRREIGVRLALGASIPGVRSMVLRTTLGIVLTGGVVGLAGALALSGQLQGMLFQVSPRDPVILGVVIGVVGGVSLLAGWIPAMRAARLDPVKVLRSE